MRMIQVRTRIQVLATHQVHPVSILLNTFDLLERSELEFIWNADWRVLPGMIKCEFHISEQFICFQTLNKDHSVTPYRTFQKTIWVPLHLSCTALLLHDRLRLSMTFDWRMSKWSHAWSRRAWIQFCVFSLRIFASERQVASIQRRDSCYFRSWKQLNLKSGLVLRYMLYDVTGSHWEYIQ